MNNFFVEVIGWLSTISFLISIVIPNRKYLHYLGIFVSVTTGFYAYKHSATAIWVKWVMAFFFHVWMVAKLSKSSASKTPEKLNYGALYP